MNKIIAAAALLASTSLSAAASDVCATIHYDFKNDLNVRSGPGIAYPVVRELHPGDTVPLLRGSIRVPRTDGTFATWQRVMYEGDGIGWVNASYIQPTHCPVAQLRQVVPVAVPVATPAPVQPAWPPVIVVNPAPNAAPPAPPVQPPSPPVVVTVVQGPGGSQSAPQPGTTSVPQPVTVQPPAPAPAPPPAWGTPVTTGTATTDVATATYFTLRDAKDIVDTSRGNEVRFNRDYKGKTFQDVLTLKSITERLLGSGYNVSFDGADCRVNATEAQRMIDWNKGQQVRVTGSIRTTAFGDLQLDACSFG
jgi:uncharacterized protein YraI